MKREHFDAILDDIDRRKEGDGFELRISMRNSEVYCGAMSFLPGAEDVLTLLTGSGRVIYIALPAIATVAEHQA